jgi:hypothetical protein
MNLSNPFKINKIRRYNYTPRYYKGKNVDNLYDFSSKFLKHRETHNKNDFGNEWQEARLKMRNKKNRTISIRLLVIISLLVFICLFILDFDISIFHPKK